MIYQNSKTIEFYVFYSNQNASLQIWLCGCFLHILFKMRHYFVDTLHFSNQFCP